MRRSLANSGHRLWSDRRGPVEVRFVGRGPGDRPAAAAACGAPAEIAWCRQVHSAQVVEAAHGLSGEGDALTTRLSGLGLSVATADCVPVLVSGYGEVAAIHAGWRGIADGVVDATLDRLASSGDRFIAWLGPAIGPCCYEVGHDVAARVAAASDPRAVLPRRGVRPHLDLQRAVRAQLRRRGVARLHTVKDCTHCSPRTLWSYRREGPGAGRNLAFIWIDA